MTTPPGNPPGGPPSGGGLSPKTIDALTKAAEALDAGGAAMSAAAQEMGRIAGMDPTTLQGNIPRSGSGMAGAGLGNNRQFASMIGQSIVDALAKSGYVPGSPTGAGGFGGSPPLGSPGPTPFSMSPLARASAAIMKAAELISGVGGGSPGGSPASSPARSPASPSGFGPGSIAAFAKAIPAIVKATAGEIAGSGIGSILASSATRWAARGIGGATGLGGLGGPFAAGASPWLKYAAQFKGIANQLSGNNATPAGNSFGVLARSALQKVAGFAQQAGITPGGGQSWSGFASRVAIHATNAAAQHVAGRAYMAASSPGFTKAFGPQASHFAQGLASQFQAFTASRGFQTSLHTGAYQAFAKMFAGGAGAVGGAAQRAGWSQVGSMIAAGLGKGLSVGSLAIAPISGLLAVTSHLAKQAEVWTSERAHLAGYSPMAARAYGRLEFGEHDRNFRMAAMTEHTLTSMVNAVNTLKDSELSQKALTQNFQNAAGSFGAGFWAQANRETNPLTNAINDGLFGKNGLVDFDPSVAGAAYIGAMKGLAKVIVNPQAWLDPAKVIQEEADKAAQEQQNLLNAPGAPQPWGPAFKDFIQKAPSIPFLAVPRIN